MANTANKNVKFAPDSDSEHSESSELEHLDRQFNKFQLLELVDNPETNYDRLDSNNDNSDIDSDVEIQASEPIQGSISKQTKSRKRRNKARRQNKNTSDEPLNKKEADIEAQIADSSSQIPKSRFLLLKIDPRHLVPENEIKRMFGRSVLKEERTKDSRYMPSFGLSRNRSSLLNSNNQRLAIGPKMELDELFNDFHATSDTKESLTNSPSKKSGKARAKDSHNPSHEKPLYFKFTHSKSYQVAHSIFLDAVMRGHSQVIMDNASLHPAHVESLIQISDMVRVVENYKSASELIETALAVFQLGFHQKFSTSGNCRLSYRRPENRSFFIAIFRHIMYSNRRGLRRTPLEYSKFLLSLEPESDPLFATLLIDFYSIRSEEYDYLIEFVSKWQHLSKFPNLSLSLPLAYFMKSKNQKYGKTACEDSLKMADEYLQSALIRYPNFIIALLNACSAEPNQELLDSDYFNYSVYSNRYKSVPEAVELLVSLYVQRNLILWKNKDVLSWLEKNVSILVRKFASKELIDEGQNLEHWSNFRGSSPKNLLRHIVLSDLEIKVPTSATNSSILDIDPYPPSESIESYSKDINHSNSGAHQSGLYSSPLEISSLFIRSILPSFSFGGDQDSNQPANR